MRVIARHGVRYGIGWLISLIVIPVLYVLEPFFKIRIVEMMEDRIGHLAGNTDIFARQLRQSSEANRYRWILIAHNPANRQLMDMWKRHFRIIESRVVKHLYMGARTLLRNTRFHADLPKIPVDWDPIVFTTPNVLCVTEAEERRGREELRKLGIADDDWYVCFHARDPLYLSTREGFGAKASKSNSAYLDSSIQNYVEAMQWIVDRGGIAVRMGNSVVEPLPDLGPRVIDYPRRGQSDFLDIYLAAKCRMFIGNNSGLFWTALIFNRPVGLTNICPFPYVGGGGKWLLDIPKLLVRKSDKSPLTVTEIKHLNMLECRTDSPAQLRYIFSGKAHEDHDLEWQENRPEEILDLCKDMMDLIEHKPPSLEARRLQKLFNSEYANAAPHTREGGISPRFALRHRDLIERETMQSRDQVPGQGQ